MTAAETTDGRARRVAIVTGILTLLLAGIEAASGSRGWRIGGVLMVKAAAVSNILHWSLGLLLLAVALAEPLRVRPFLAVAAVGLLATAAVGARARNATGHILGFDAALPWSYVVAHAAIGLVAAFGLVGSNRRRVASPNPRRDTADLPR